MRNYYDILGISSYASQMEIKAAFKKLALLYHPDKNNGDELMEERFKEINRAYQILSNPFEKAKYDISFFYEKEAASVSSNTSQYTTYSQTNSTHSRPNTKRTYSKPKINWKENWIATAYAFGFTLIVATVVMIGINIKKYVDESKYQATLVERRLIFDQAKVAFANDKIEAAVQSVNSLGILMPEEKDIKEYKIAIFESFVFEGETSFNHGEFEEAIDYFELIEKYSPSKPLTLKEHLAKSYQATNQPQKAIALLEELLSYNYRNLEIYVSLAETYRDIIKNNEEALRYYELGDKLAIKKYESVYGKAYPLVMTGKYLPPAHYKLYSGLADIHLKLGNPEMAIKTTKWNVKIWPDSSKCFITTALGYQELGEYEKACEAYTRAIELGASMLSTINCP